jgi:amino acid adenylation domain-containing protein
MNQFASIPHVLAHRAEQQPHDTAFTFLGGGLSVERVLTYGQLAEATARVAGFLRERVRPGERVLLLFPPGADYLSAFLGCLAAGVVAVPLYPPRPGAKLDRIDAVVRDCQAAVALTTAALLPLLSDLPVPVLTVEDHADTVTTLPGEDDLAFLQYTSGSTGDPKGVMVSHRNLTANLSAIAGGFGVRDDDVIFSWLPMYHDMGLIGTTLLPLFTGRPAVLLNTFEFVRDPLAWLVGVDRFGATCSGGPSFAYRLLTERYDEDRMSHVDLSRWRIAFNGAEPVSAGVMAAFTERYADHGFAGHAWFPCYGLAEATLFVSGAGSGYRTAEVDGKAVVSSGTAAEDTEIIIRDPDGRPLPDGTVGEICVRGPGVAQGYWNQGSFGAFLATGDLGALVAGELHVAGRVKDLIIVGGRNYHPHDVEVAAEARGGAAFQVDDRVVLVLEVPPKSTLDGDAVRRAVQSACELELAEVVFVRPHSIPRTSSGKIRRAETRRRYLDGRLKVVGTTGGTAKGNGLRGLLAERIGFALTDDDFRRPLAALGMDSLKLVAIKGAVEQALGVALPAELFFGDATLDDVIAAARTAAPAAPVVAPDTYAATDSQLQLQFFDQLHPDDRSNTLSCALHLNRAYTDAELRAAVTGAVARHAALRTTIRDGMQVVHDEPRFDWAVTDGLTEFAYRPFDLAEGPLVRAAAGRGPDGTTLLLACHHAVADYASLRIVLADVLAELVGDKGFALSTGPTTALGWAAEQARTTDDGRLAGLADRWRPHRDHVLFPAPPSARRRNPAATVDFAVDAARTGLLYRHCKERGFTPFVTLAAAYLRALHRVTGAPTVTIGTPHHGRADTRFAGAVGYLVNPVPLLGDFTAGDDLPALEDRTWRELRDALTHADVPFPRLVRALSPARHGQNPLFQAILTFQQSADGRLGDGFAIPWSGARATVAGVAVEVEDLPPRDTAFALGLYGARDGDRLVLRLVYQRELVDEPTARRVAEEFRLAVDEAIGLKHATPAEDDEAAPTLAWVANLSDGFARAVELFGDRTALRDNGIALSYRDLDTRVAALAGALHSTVDNNAPVGILLERSADMVVAALAVIRTGASYVPVDPGTPAARVALILDDAAPSLVITSTGLADRVPDGVRTLLVDEPLPPAVPMAAGCCPATWDSRAYVIFTSGTTGRPKGVQVSHGNLLRLFTSTEHQYGFGPGDVWSLFHSFAFDVSVWEMWGALLHGGCLVVVPREVAKDPAAFRVLLRDERVTVLSQTPTAFNQLIAEDVRHADRLPLRWVVFGGEALHFADLRRWIAKYGDNEPRLVNMYGITETTVHSSFRRVRRADLDQGSSLIGLPLSDSDFVLVDERLNPVRDGEIGEVGEIIVTGPGVAMGYLNRPELTAERFVTVQGVRGYRSGDLAARTASGEYAYHGRRDDQVKIRGFRVELSEIRAALGAVPGVLRTAVVVDRPHATPVVKQRAVSDRITETRDLIRGAARAPGTRIVAYVVGDDTLVPDVVFEHLRARLPEYMRPAFVVAVDEIPTNHNGKVAKDELPAPTAANCLRERAPSRESGDVDSAGVQQMCALFEEVLDTTGVRPDDSFFSVGGDSIIALRLRAAALARGVSVELGDLYTLQTPRALAEHLGIATGGPAVEPPTPVEPFALLDPADRAAMPDDVVDAYPIGTLQAGLLFHSAYQTDVNMYCDIFMFRLRAPYDLDAMTEAIAQVVARHEILRTSFDFTRFSQPLQLVHHTGRAELSCADLSGLDEAGQEAELTAWRQREMATPYDWARAPLVRFAVHRLSDEEFQFSMGFHDALLDGWSESALVTEILGDYWALLGGAAPAVHEPPELRFADYIAAERTILASETAREFWSAELAEVEPTLLPRLAAGSTDAHDGRMGFLSVDVPADLSARLDELASANRVSLKHVLLAVQARVLALLTGRAEVVLGVESNGRVEGPGGAEVLGVHLNVVPYRLSTGARTWTELIGAALAKETALLDVRAYPYAEVQRLAGVRELTDVSFNYTHFHGYQRLATATGIAVLDAKAYLQTNFTLRTEFNKDPFSKLLTLDLEANLERVTEPQLRQIAAAYRTALEHVVAAPDQVPSNRDLLGEDRWRALLTESAGPVRPRQDSGFLAVFARSAARHADRVAAVCGQDSLTYHALAGRVGACAGWLHANGVGAGTVVGLRGGRNLAYLVAVLAIMRVGAVYLPLPAGPAVRVASMVRRGGAAMVLHDSASSELVREAAGSAVTVDLTEALAADHEPYQGASPGGDDSAYIIFTSGSTGEPKGALIRHDGMLNHVQAKIDALGLTSADRVSQDAAATFDISLWQWFAPLAVGGTTVVYPDELAQDPPTLLRAVAEDRVTVLEVAPSVLSVFCAELDHYGISAYPPFALRWVASSGETLKPKAANEFRRLLPAVRVMNMWGITETSDDVTHYELTGEADERAPSVPVGVPIANSAVYVLDANREPAPVGTPGELYVGGVCVGAGYVNDPDRTAAAFVPDPFTPGAVLYRTGDRGRRLADGGFEFLGRLDSQLKIRGQRVELGEVERALTGVAGIRESAVVVWGDESGEKRLAGFFVTSVELSTSDLRTALGAVLPRYAVPDFLIRLDELPRTPHGKVDALALAHHDLTDPVEPAAAGTPATPTEAVVLDVIGTVLKRPVTDAAADFFELGGHSLHATQVMARLRDRFGVDLPLRLLFDLRTARELARRIDTADLSAESYTPERIPRRPAGTTRFPLARNQASLWFLHQVDPDDRAYENTSLMHITGPLDVEALRAAVELLGRRHEALTTRFDSEAGVPYQELQPAARLTLEVLDAVTDDVVAQVREQGGRFDLARGPVARARLWRISATEHVFEWSCHHIVSDGWSSDVAMRDLREAYLAHVAGRTPELPRLPAQYGDHARWQERFLADHAQREQGFWKSYLDGYDGELALATDFVRTEDRSRAAGYATWTWDGATAERLRAFATARQVTPFLLAQAATAALMAKLTQQSDLVLGAVVAGRTVPGTEHLVGFFANTLPLRYTVDFGDTPAGLVGSVARSALSALENQLLPFSTIVESSGTGRTPGVAPLVQVLVTFDNFPLDLTGLPGLSTTLTRVPPVTSQFDLLFRFVEADGLTLTVQYDATLFTPATVTRLLAAMDAVLDFFLTRPDEPLSSAVLVREEDRHALASLSRALTGGPFDPDGLLASPRCAEFLALVEKRGLLTALLLAL